MPDGLSIESGFRQRLNVTKRPHFGRKNTPRHIKKEQHVARERFKCRTVCCWICHDIFSRHKTTWCTAYSSVPIVWHVHAFNCMVFMYSICISLLCCRCLLFNRRPA